MSWQERIVIDANVLVGKPILRGMLSPSRSDAAMVAVGFNPRNTRRPPFRPSRSDVGKRSIVATRRKGRVCPLTARERRTYARIAGQLKQESLYFEITEAEVEFVRPSSETGDLL